MDAAALPDGSKRQAELPPFKAAYALHWAMGLPLWGDRFRAWSNAVTWKPYGGYTMPPRSLRERSRTATPEDPEDAAVVPVAADQH
jgi:hypothetical protein